MRFRGYVTNCGDITLTNVVATDTRTGAVTLVHPVAGTNLTGNVTLTAGAYAVFTNSFTASPLENCVCLGTNSITVTAQDNVGGPFSYVTNTYAATHPIEFQPNP